MTYEDALAILRDGWPITPEDLTQIAADIWDEGWRAGSLDVTHRYAPETPNPYLDTEAE